MKNPPANAGDIRDAGSIPGSGGPPGGGFVQPVFFLENSMDRGSRWATVQRIAKGRTQCMHTYSIFE